MMFDLMSSLANQSILLFYFSLYIVLSWLLPIGMSKSMAKIMKCASNDDIITIRSEDSPDNVTFVFESPSKSIHTNTMTVWNDHQ